MKTKWLLWLVVAIMAFLSMSALAAPEDRNFLRGEGTFAGVDDNPRGGCAIGDALVLYGYSHIFTYHIGDDDFAAAAYALPEAGEDESGTLARLFADGDRLYALVTVFHMGEDGYGPSRLELMEVEIDGEDVRFGEPVAAEVGDLTVSYGDSADLAEIDNAVCAGGSLFLHITNETGERKVYVLPMNGGAGEFLNVEKVQAIAAWEGEQVLIETFDREEQRCEFWLCDPENGSLTPVCDPVRAESAFFGVTYSLETGRLFYMKDGYVMAAEGFDFDHAEPVAELYTRYFYECDCMLLPGDYYVCCGWYDSTSIRSTAPGALPQTRLTVQSAGVNNVLLNAYYGFTSSHSDAAVVLREDYTEDSSIAQAMMSRDSSVDIYMLSVNTEAYDALYARGYMAVLNDPAIAEAVGEMYPAIQEAIMLDGDIVAVPVMLYGWTLGLDYEGFEKIGIPREEMPDNWSDFLDLLPELPALLPEDGSVRIFGDYYTQRQARAELVTAILDGWHLRLDAAGEAIHYDSPELQALLDKVMALDLDAFGLPEGDEDAEYMMVSVVGGGADRTYTLVTPSAGCSIGGFFYGSEPALLSVIPGEPQPVPLSLSVAFVNPFSENVDLAQAFLKEILENLDTATIYNLSDKLNEPVRGSYYERAIGYAREELARAQEGLEAADAADVPLWEERIAAIEEQMEMIDESGWAVSPKDLAWYRGHDDNLMVKRYHHVDVMYGSGEFADLAQQFMDGRLDAGAFLEELDRRARMKLREGN